MSRGLDFFGGRRHLHPGAAADDEKALALEDPISPGDGIQVDPQVAGEPAHWRKGHPGSEGTRSDEFPYLVGNLTVNRFFHPAIDGDGQHHDVTVH